MKTVYLVDDDQDDRYLIRQAIQQTGVQVEVIEAENGLELLHLIQQNDTLSAALILLDMNMPKMNGLETTLALKADATTLDIPVVMISTSSNKSLIESAYQAGINSFITKPSSFQEFSELGDQLAARFLS
ncbi:response regulator [Telluribacter humicola]|jgi:CheY-like chemotaxis protein|uniref:response regulator n=1 Tax=Telluribacter humicola TaxID=1720261 RepID=UPI001A96D48C|nr:response regulator [Telluribacter humicola]